LVPLLKWNGDRRPLHTRAMTGVYEELKRWLESLGISTVAQSVAVEDGVVAVVEEGVVDEVSSIVMDDIYETLGIERAPWLIEEDIGNRRIMKSPVGVWRKL